MRIGKYLSHAGYGTRKDVKNLIRKKLVTVNDALINTDSINIDETKDIIKVDDEIVEYKEFYYLILNKLSFKPPFFFFLNFIFSSYLLR